MIVLIKGINLVAQFIRTITKILKYYIPYYALPFLDNIIVKGPQTVYNGKESLLGIYRYILKYIYVRLEDSLLYYIPSIGLLL